VRPLEARELDAVCEHLPGRGRAQHAARLEAQARGSYRYLIAWRDGRAVGHVGLGIPDDRRIDEVCEFRGNGLVDDLSVEPPYRGLGIGRALMDALEREARAARLPGLSLDTGLDDGYRAARSLYRTLGYRDLGGAFILSAKQPPGSPLRVFVEILTIWTKPF
jgi:GNAT superfamily N-acetyltransferase